MKELIKGVASMKTFVYPSVLQSAAIPVLKSTDKKAVIIRYSEMSGIKLTLLLPIINQQTKYAVSESESLGDKVAYSVVLCHSNIRCQELGSFTEELTGFCKDIIDVVIFESSDLQDIKVDWKQRCEESKGGDDEDEA